MKVSATGRQKLTSREGYRLLAYQDSVGVWTIGVGHTGRMSPPQVRPGMTITAQQADAFLASDLAPVEEAIDSHLKVQVSQNQFDAMASLAFNIGVLGFIGSSVLKAVNAGHFALAANDFLLWEKPAILRARREAERKQFLTPDPQVPAAPLLKKDDPMSLDLSKVNILAGITNLVGNVISGIKSSISVVDAGNNSITVAPGTNSNGVVGSVFGSIQNAQTAIQQLEKVIADAKAGNWSEEPADVEHLLKTVFAILSTFGVNVPVVSAIVEALPDLSPVK